MNNEKILAHVRMFVLREKLLCPGEPLHLAAAVSGGADTKQQNDHSPVSVVQKDT